MNKQLVAKALGLSGAALIAVFLALSASGVTSWSSFWMVAILLAGIAYWVLPALRKE